MNNTEAVLILRKVRAYRPAQTVDNLTGEAWAEALDDIRFEDAREAVTNIAKASSAWIDPALIRIEVKRIRARRMATTKEDTFMPSSNDLTPLEQMEEYRNYWRSIANGDSVSQIDLTQLPTRPQLTALTKGIHQ